MTAPAYRQRRLPGLPELPAPRRVAWPELPSALRAEVEGRLGGPVTGWRTEWDGFSPGLTARLRSTAGRCFVKAADRRSDPITATLHDREWEVASALPASLPAARPLFRVTAGDWIALGFEEIDGAPPALPWSAADRQAVLAAAAVLGEVPAPPELGDWGEQRAGEWAGWQLLAAGGPPDGLDAWALRHLDRLVELERRFPQAVQGAGVVHSDLRSDNVLLTADRVIFVDWAWGARGADWIDPLIMCITGALEGLGRPQEVFRASPTGRRADPDAMLPVLAALAGMYTVAAASAPLARLPGLRQFQAAEARVATAWLAEITGWR